MRVCIKELFFKFNMTGRISHFHENFSFQCLTKFSSQHSSANIIENDNSKLRIEQKILKIAIVGVPNSGKSTLINQIIGRNVFAISRKVHTTRCCARAVLIDGNTQLIFLDTPGLVSVKESIKHHLERTFLVDSEEAIKEADIIGVTHDVSNKYTMFKLDPKILRLLYLHQNKHAFLILNKVDAMRSKRDLLDCVKILTEQSNRTDTDHYSYKTPQTEVDLQELINTQCGWPHFKDVFMVSGLTGDGVGDIQMYLLKLAKPGEWMFPKSVITDQNETSIVQNCVFSKLLDNLPNVVPYNLKVQLEYFNVLPSGAVVSVVLIVVKTERIKKLILGAGGSRIRQIATDIEQSLRTFYLNDVRLKLVVQLDENLKLKDDVENKLSAQHNDQLA